MRLIAPALGFLCALGLRAQVITTVAGTDFVFPNYPIPAIDAPLGQISGTAVDAAGNIYLADPNNRRVTRISPNGTLTVVAGNGISVNGGLGAPSSGDGGPAVLASVPYPNAIVLDSAGNLYIADGGRVRKVSNGIISTFAGTGNSGPLGDGGPATSATLESVSGLALDSSGNLYILDYGNDRIRKVANGVITTVAGGGSAAPANGIAATSASFFFTEGGIACDAAGNLYIADSHAYRVWKISNGILSTVAGTGEFSFPSVLGDGGPATSAQLSPTSVAFDSAGNLYIADSANARIRKVSGGIITTIAGNGQRGFSGDGGPALNATLDVPLAISIAPSGVVYFADVPGTGVGSGRLRGITPEGIIQTFAGNGNYRFSGDGGPAASATFNWFPVSPVGVAVDSGGNLYVTDTYNNRIRKISQGTITTVAGNGVAAFSGDGGPAPNASLNQPTGVAVDPAGNLYIADGGNQRVRKVSGGMISTVAGGGSASVSTAAEHSVSATGVSLSVEGVAVDAAGDLFIVGGNMVEKVSGGLISIVAGTGIGGFSGDGGPATKATFLGALAVAVDSAGDTFYVADFNNNLVRIVKNGIINTFAGTGQNGPPGDGGPATGANVANPFGLAVDAAGNLYISGFNGARIRKVSNGIITTVAGNGDAGFSGDGGLAIDAQISDPTGLAVNASGDIFIADTLNNRVREVLTVPPAAQAAPSQLQFSASSAGSIPPPQTISLTSAVPGIAFSAQSSASWLTVTPASGASPRLIEVTADPTTLPPGQHTGTITLSTPYANLTGGQVEVSFNVGPQLPPQLFVDKTSLSFPFPQSAASRSQTVTVFNTGGGTLSFTATTQTTSGGNWLAVAPGAGQVLPSSPVPLSVTANPAGLAPGTYSGSLTIAAGSTSTIVPVTMTISRLSQAILLSQSGLSFLGVANGGVVLPQSFGVINIGSGVVNWTVSTSTLSGGNWLQVDRTSGSTDASSPTVPVVNVSVNASSLAAGKYYGQVRVDAPGAANTPQVITIFLQVLPAGSATSAAVQPAELLFTATAGDYDSSPSSQQILVSDISGLPTSFQAVLSLDVPAYDLPVLPVQNTLDPQNPTAVVVQPITYMLPPGVYQEVITFQFSDGSVSAVKAKIVVANGAGASSSARPNSQKTDRPSDSSACQPSQLLTALTTLGQSFAVSAGWPVALQVTVQDDCGNPLNPPGTVMVSFSNGDPRLQLQSVKSGQWAATWVTNSSSAAQVNLTIQANDPQNNLSGVSQISGALQYPTDPPAFALAGIVSAAEPKSFVPAAPGSILSIYGNLLAQNNMPASSIPLPTELAETQAAMAGELMPLYYVSPTQVNLQVPYDININAPQQILIQRGVTLSQPIEVNVAPAQPAIFEDTSAAPHQGIIYVVRGQGASQIQFEAKPGSPAKAGDVIVAYCAGLGAVTPAVATGAAGGVPVSSTTNTVALSVGGQSATVAFAGLAPGFVGLYQVNSVVPQGTSTGNSVPVILSVAGQTSAPVTIAIQE